MSLSCRRICYLLLPLFLSLALSSLCAQGSEQALEEQRLFENISTDSVFISGDSIFIDSIGILGNVRTKDRIVYREITLQQGVCYHRHEFLLKLRQSREQLMNTALFVSVQIDTLETPSNTLTVIFHLNERWYLYPVPFFNIVDRNFNVWLKDHNASMSRTNYGAKLVYYNFSGRNDELNAWAIMGYTQQLQLRYNNPFANKQMEWGYRVGALYNRNRELNYANDSNKQVFKELSHFGVEKIEGEFTLSYRKGSKFRAYLKNFYVHQSIDTALFRLNPDYFNGRKHINYADVILNMQYFDVDYIPFPLRGWYVDGYIQQRISSSVPMFRFGGKALATWQFVPRTYINFQTAFAITPRSNLPFVNQKLVGYDHLYLQGLENNVIDGSSGGFFRTTFRHMVFAKDFRGPRQLKSYQVLPLKVFLKTYGNLGYAYNKNPGTSYMNNRLLYTGGVGLEIMTIHDIVGKLEYSFNQFGGRGFFIHTTFDF